MAVTYHLLCISSKIPSINPFAGLTVIDCGRDRTDCSLAFHTRITLMLAFWRGGDSGFITNVGLYSSSIRYETFWVIVSGIKERSWHERAWSP
jgi:hypothetical protein